MSIYAVFDDDADGDQIATVAGWGDCTRWIEGLSADDFPQLAHLSEYGWSQELGDLSDEIVAALKDSPPEDDDTRDVAQTLLDALKTRDDPALLLLTDGMTTADVPPDARCGGVGSGVPGPCPEGDKGAGGGVGGKDGDAKDTPKITGSGTLTDGTKIDFVPHEKQRDDEKTVMVDAAKLDAAWEKDKGYYLGPGQEHGDGKRAGVEEFLKKGEPVQASRVTLDKSGTASFQDGRHRFAVLRDKGIDKMAITISKDEAKYAKDLK